MGLKRGRFAEDLVNALVGVQERPAHISEPTWRIARYISLCSHPLVLALPVSFAVSYQASPRWSERLRWSGISGGILCGLAFLQVKLAAPPVRQDSGDRAS
jgi:hypothetical protein